jgi:hypothetical protein
MTDRIPWTDVQRAASRFAEVLSTHGLIPRGLTFTVARGSVTYGNSGALYWAPLAADSDQEAGDEILGSAPLTIPGGWQLPRSTRDAYDQLVARTRMVHDIWALQREAERRA